MGDTTTNNVDFVKDRYSYDKNEYDKYTKNEAHPNLSYTDTLATKQVKTGTENLTNPKLSYTDTLANPNNIYTDNLKEPYDPYAKIAKEQMESVSNDSQTEIEKEIQSTKSDYSRAAIIFLFIMLVIVVGILLFVIL